jgi:hypothetical protein
MLTNACKLSLLMLMVIGCKDGQSQSKPKPKPEATKSATPKRPATCEAAGDRYIELYIKEAKAAGMMKRRALSRAST